jgi:hypothetical protein
MDISKIKDNPGLIRDTKTQAVLNVDISALQGYKLKRKKQKQMDIAVEDINNMKQDINDLKTLMQRILDKIG